MIEFSFILSFNNDNDNVNLKLVTVKGSRHNFINFQ